MHVSAPPTPGPLEDPGSFVLRFGTAVALSAAGALLCALPAASRVSGALAGTVGTARVWVALAAAALVPMVTAVVALRGAREGLRGFGGPGAGLRAYGVALWLASLVVMFTLFGGLLRATTHHHALAGVTFALGALALAVGSALVCARIVGILRGCPLGVRRALAGALALPTVVALGWVGLRFLAAASHDPASAGAAGTILDVLAFVLAALFAARSTLIARRALAIIGPPVAVAVVAVGLSTLRDRPVRDAIAQRAPAFAPVVDVLSDP